MLEKMDYSAIKQYAKETGQRVNDLIVLAPQNDPFYAGTPGDWEMAHWFQALWNAFYQGQNMHIRRVHYQIISQDPPIVLPNGLPYENTERCWDYLNQASKMARYLRLVDPEAFNDRRNPDPISYANYPDASPEVRTRLGLWQSDLRLPGFPNMPSYAIDNFDVAQPYHLEIWCEKSTMNDVLLPLCQRYGAVLQTGLGELSITATLAAVHRLEQAERPARIFYVSDFDPAGQSMPVAVSRKIEYFVRTLGLNADVRLFPVILTLDQVRHYQLPRTPIKETERRRDSFEGRHGEGAVELDALEALYPGQLQMILSQYIETYYDTSLYDRVQEARAEVEQGLSQLWQQVTGRYTDDVAALHAEYMQLEQDFGARMSGYADRLRTVWQAIQGELNVTTPDIVPWLPSPHRGSEVGSGLLNTEWDYLEQVDVYKLFQGRE
jgi:hypothetical protein